jgi:phosphoserine phosphatase RsbU/P
MIPGDIQTEHRHQRLRALTEVSRALTYTTSIEEVLRVAVERAAELMEADRALLMLTDADGLLVVRAAYGIDERRLRDVRAPLNETLVSRLQTLLEYPSAAGFLSVPLVAQGEVIGLLAAVRPGGETVSDDDEWLLSALADQAAVALENARLTRAVLERDKDRGAAAEAENRARATLGHELRSPLTAIQAYSSLLLEGVLDPLTDRQREGVARIRMSGEHLLSIIENVLDATRLEAGALKLVNRNVPITEVLTQALQMVHPQQVAKEQDLTIDAGDGLVVRGDPGRVRQVLVNLVGNAIKYTPARGTIRVDVSALERGDQRYATIAVADSGPGIPPEVVTSIFEPYDRGGASPSEAGLGLGLFISRQLARQMGGEIEVESEPGGGSRFTVLLPLAPDVTGRTSSSP